MCVCTVEWVIMQGSWKGEGAGSKAQMDGSALDGSNNSSTAKQRGKMDTCMLGHRKMRDFL